MSEVEKLKQRLKNIGRNTTEYRMTVEEARALVSEFDELSKKLAEKPVPVIVQAPLPHRTNILDGGGF